MRRLPSRHATGDPVQQDSKSGGRRCQVLVERAGELDTFLPNPNIKKEMYIFCGNSTAKIDCIRSVLLDYYTCIAVLTTLTLHRDRPR